MIAYCFFGMLSVAAMVIYSLAADNRKLRAEIVRQKLQLEKFSKKTTR